MRGLCLFFLCGNSAANKVVQRMCKSKDIAKVSGEVFVVFDTCSLCGRNKYTGFVSFALDKQVYLFVCFGLNFLAFVARLK